MIWQNYCFSCHGTYYLSYCYCFHYQAFQHDVDFSHIAIRRSTLDGKQQAKTLWEYDTQAMKKAMEVVDDSKVSSILSDMHNKIKMVISR